MTFFTHLEIILYTASPSQMLVWDEPPYFELGTNFHCSGMHREGAVGRIHIDTHLRITGMSFIIVGACMSVPLITNAEKRKIVWIMMQKPSVYAYSL
mmetsp:Transcript_4029/g.4583  ORF Transcript_4029/g.4583 Transcript_4029/m.4583 type:complete len:97 (-) Transcript_4029:225-515(-)